MPKILIVATGIGAYANAILPTGLWLSELTHIYHRAKGLGCKITIASPKGGEIPVDPESLKPFTLDKMSKAYWNDPEFRELLHHAQSLDEVAGRRFDCVYLAGGHGSMYDFPDNAVLQAILKTYYIILWVLKRNSPHKVSSCLYLERLIRSANIGFIR